MGGRLDPARVLLNSGLLQELTARDYYHASAWWKIVKIIRERPGNVSRYGTGDAVKSVCSTSARLANSTATIFARLASAVFQTNRRQSHDAMAVTCQSVRHVCGRVEESP